MELIASTKRLKLYRVENWRGFRYDKNNYTIVVDGKTIQANVPAEDMMRMILTVCAELK